MNMHRPSKYSIITLYQSTTRLSKGTTLEVQLRVRSILCSTSVSGMVLQLDKAEDEICGHIIQSCNSKKLQRAYSNCQSKCVK